MPNEDLCLDFDKAVWAWLCDVCLSFLRKIEDDKKRDFNPQANSTLWSISTNLIARAQNSLVKYPPTLESAEADIIFELKKFFLDQIFETKRVGYRPLSVRIKQIRAILFEKKQQLEIAKRDAASLISLAYHPNLEEGYLTQALILLPRFLKSVKRLAHKALDTGNPFTPEDILQALSNCLMIELNWYIKKREQQPTMPMLPKVKLAHNVATAINTLQQPAEKVHASKQNREEKSLNSDINYAVTQLITSINTSIQDATRGNKQSGTFTANNGIVIPLLAVFMNICQLAVKQDHPNFDQHIKEYLSKKTQPEQCDEEERLGDTQRTRTEHAASHQSIDQESHLDHSNFSQAGTPLLTNSQGQDGRIACSPHLLWSKPPSDGVVPKPPPNLQI